LQCFACHGLPEEEKDDRIGYPTLKFPVRWFKLRYYKLVGTEIACIVDLLLSFSYLVVTQKYA
jgi:hypothetical protein